MRGSSRVRARYPRAGAAVPSGRFFSNAAWLVLTTLAHNLLRWTSQLGLSTSGLVVAKTLRRRLLTLPGRLTRSARRRRLHLPTGSTDLTGSTFRYPWVLRPFGRGGPYPA